MKNNFSRIITVVELFQRAVKQFPDDIAIIYGDRKISYLELDILSSQLAVFIKQQYNLILNHEITPGTTIAICISRNVEMMIVILGVLKAGAAYVVINPELPVEGIKYIVDNSDSKVILEYNAVIDKQKLANLSTNHEIPVIIATEDHLPKQKYLVEHLKLNPSDLAYIMYTSGTTGAPKGVRVAHHSLAFFCQVYAEKMEINRGVVVDYLLSPVFTGSIPCYFPPLLTGGTLLIQPMDVLLNPQVYAESIKQSNAMVLKYTPTIFNFLFPYLSTALDSKNLKIVLSGETLLASQIKQYLVHKNWVFYNQYGFTECVAGFCSYKIEQTEINSDYVPVGIPYQGREKRIVDEKLNLVSDGDVGELLVGGLGLAEGYQKLPEETKRKFILLDKKRYYRTGDLARVNTFGNIEILKRNDNQIKVNGIRIETAEIENKILECHGIKNCLVALSKVVGSQNKELIAYYNCNVVGEVNRESIIIHLSKYLASYMIPQFYIEVPNFPYNENGKVDRNKLLSEYKASITQILHESIQNEMQQYLQQIWQGVLLVDINYIGKNSDFFQLGGNSLKAYQVLIRLNDKYRLNFTVQDVFNYRTIEQQESFILEHTKHFIQNELPHMVYIDEEF